MMQPFVKPNFECWTSNSVEASMLASFQRFWNDWIFNTLDQISIKKTQKPNCEIWTLKAVFSERLSLDFDDSCFKEANARLRGWQRITTKLKHNNCNHRSSMGLETLRVDSPSWGVC